MIDLWHLTELVLRALLSNPSYTDPAKSAMNLILCNGVIVGRFMMMQTRIKSGYAVFTAQRGGGIEISKNLRGVGLGRIIMDDTFRNCEYPVCTGQLYSSGAIAIVRKLGLTTFGKPLYVKLCRKRSVLAAEGLSGEEFRMHEQMGDLRLKEADEPVRQKLAALKQKYVFRKETDVPAWTEQMTLCDGHRFTEVHDRAWLQWNLDHCFTKNSDDRNDFYAVYDLNGQPCGFFMTKERFEENPDGFFKNLVCGTVVEWGSFDENVLTEADLNRMAISTFSSNVDKINTVLSTEKLDAEMQAMGFEYRGMYQMSLKVDDTTDSGILDQNNWRILYGGANTILV